VIAIAQGPGDGVRGTIVVPAGGVVSVDVGVNESEVELTEVGGGFSSKATVEPGKTANIPIPGVQGGSVLILKLGKGPRARMMVIEVISALGGR